MTDSFTGASSEYRAAAWFLSNHHQVYWPSLQQSDVDFIADMGINGLNKIQVKTATQVREGSWRVRIASPKYFANTIFNFDLLICISREGHIWMLPKSSMTPSLTLKVNGYYYVGKF